MYQLIKVGAWKCNVHASIFKKQGCYWVGMCLSERNERSSLWWRQLGISNAAEARVLKEAINWLSNLRFPSVSIELDRKQVPDDISSNLNTDSMFNTILNGC